MEKKIYISPALTVEHADDVILTSDFKDDNSLGWDTGKTAASVAYDSFCLD